MNEKFWDNITDKIDEDLTSQTAERLSRGVGAVELKEVKTVETKKKGRAPIYIGVTAAVLACAFTVTALTGVFGVGNAVPTGTVGAAGVTTAESTPHTGTIDGTFIGFDGNGYMYSFRADDVGGYKLVKQADNGEQTVDVSAEPLGGIAKGDGVMLEVPRGEIGYIMYYYNSNLELIDSRENIPDGWLSYDGEYAYNQQSTLAADHTVEKSVIMINKTKADGESVAEIDISDSVGIYDSAISHDNKLFAISALDNDDITVYRIYNTVNGKTHVIASDNNGRFQLESCDKGIVVLCSDKLVLIPSECDDDECTGETETLGEIRNTATNNARFAVSANARYYATTSTESDICTITVTDRESGETSVSVLDGVTRCRLAVSNNGCCAAYLDKNTIWADFGYSLKADFSSVNANNVSPEDSAIVTTTIVDYTPTTTSVNYPNDFAEVSQETQAAITTSNVITTTVTVNEPNSPAELSQEPETEPENPDIKLIPPVEYPEAVSEKFGAEHDGARSENICYSWEDCAGADVFAAADGVVTFAENNGNYGNMITIDHGNGCETSYFHLDQMLVEVGETVTSGQMIATIGATGWTTGSCLGFSLTCDGVKTDPLLAMQN